MSLGSLLIYIFLSPNCPCSQSHVEHLNHLAQAYAQVQFIGVMSEPISEKNQKTYRDYFTPARFAFPIQQDDQQLLVKKYGALKTPHVTIVRNPGANEEIIYQGGVSDQRTFSPTAKLYLQDNLNQLAKTGEVKYAQGVSLGCYIRRH